MCLSVWQSLTCTTLFLASGIKTSGKTSGVHKLLDGWFVELAWIVLPVLLAQVGATETHNFGVPHISLKYLWHAVYMECTLGHSIQFSSATKEVILPLCNFAIFQTPLFYNAL